MIPCYLLGSTPTSPGWYLLLLPYVGEDILNCLRLECRSLLCSSWWCPLLTAPHFSWPLPCSAPFLLLSYCTWSIGMPLLFLFPPLDFLSSGLWNILNGFLFCSPYLSPLLLNQLLSKTSWCYRVCLWPAFLALSFPLCVHIAQPPTIHQISCCYFHSSAFAQALSSSISNVVMLPPDAWICPLDIKPPVEFQPLSHKLYHKTGLSPYPSNGDEK